MGLLIKLLLEAPFLLRKEFEAIVADLGQSDALDGRVPRGESVFRLLTLAGDTGAMLVHQRLVDDLALL